MRIILFISLLILSIPVYASSEKVYNAESITLDNGLQVVVISNHRAPVVSHMMWYKVGSADEPQGDNVSGAAHFLEHMMFKGTKAIPPGEFSKIIRGMGGEDNAFTSWDYTAYFQSVAKEQLPRVMALEADRMINIILPEDHISSEHKVIIEERRSRTDNDPQNLFAEQIRAMLFTTTPYGEPIIGWRDDMPRLKKIHLEDYYKTWYHPNNAILVISGDVTMAEVKPLAEKFYGIIPRRDVPKHIRPTAPDFPAPITLKFESAELRQPVFIRAWRAPSYITNKDEAMAIEILTEVLSGGSSTELYQSLVVKDKIATDISLSYEGDSRGEGSIWLYAVPAPQISLENLENAIQKKLMELVEGGIDSKEIDKAKTRLIDSEIYARDSVMGPAMVVGQSLAYGLTLDDVETRPQKIAVISPEQINSALKKFFNPINPPHLPVTGFMIPKRDKGDK